MFVFCQNAILLCVCVFVGVFVLFFGGGGVCLFVLHSSSVAFIGLLYNTIQLNSKLSSLFWIKQNVGDAQTSSWSERSMAGPTVRRTRRPPRAPASLAAKNATEKVKGAEKWKINSHTPQGPSDGGKCRFCLVRRSG